MNRSTQPRLSSGSGRAGGGGSSVFLATVATALLLLRTGGALDGSRWGGSAERIAGLTATAGGSTITTGSGGAAATQYVATPAAITAPIAKTHGARGSFFRRIGAGRSCRVTVGSKCSAGAATVSS